MSADYLSNCNNPCHFTTDGDTYQGHFNCSNTECADSTKCTTLPTGIILGQKTPLRLISVPGEDHADHY